MTKNTVASTLIDTIDYILYRANNDGDIIGNFQNRHNVESAATFLFNKIQYYFSLGDAKKLSLLEINFTDYNYKNLFFEDYIDNLVQIRRQIIDLIDSYPDLYDFKCKYTFFEEGDNDINIIDKDFQEIYFQYLDPILPFEFKDQNDAINQLQNLYHNKFIKLPNYKRRVFNHE